MDKKLRSHRDKIHRGTLWTRVPPFRKQQVNTSALDGGRWFIKQRCIEQWIVGGWHTGSTFWLRITFKRIEYGELINPCKVARVACHQWQAMHERGTCHQRITQ